MFKAKKILSLISVVIVLVFLLTLPLAGCASKGNNDKAAQADTPAAASNQQAATQTEPKLQPVTISMYFPGDTQKSEADVEAKLAEYLKDKINATIDLKPLPWDGLGDKLSMMLMSGQEMDLVFTPSWLGFYNNAAKGAFLDLTGLLEKYGQGIKQTINPAFLNGPKIDGKLYAIPTNKELSQGLSYIFRKDLVEKYKIDLSKITTVDNIEKELGDIFKVIKENEPGISPTWVDADHPFIPFDKFRTDVEKIGDDEFSLLKRNDKNFKIINATEEPMDVQLKLANIERNFYKAGYINKDANTTKVRVQDAAKAGKVFGWTILAKPGSDVEWSNDVGMQMVEVKVQKPYVTTGDTVGSMIAISRTSKNPERAMMFLNLLHSDKFVNNIINFGIEGVHYTKVSDNIIKVNKDTGYSPGTTWMMGNQFLNFLQENEDPKRWEKFKTFNDTAEVSPILGFVFNPEPVKTLVSAVNSIQEEYGRILKGGTVDPEKYINERNAKLKAAGLDKLIAEKQKQLDAWLAANKKK